MFAVFPLQSRIRGLLSRGRPSRSAARRRLLLEELEKRQMLSTYYLSADGSDANAGTSAASPWQTIHQLNTFSQQTGFQPGDVIAFHAGETFTADSVDVDPVGFSPLQGGTALNPIRITSYVANGQSDGQTRATLVGLNSNVIEVDNQAGYEIDNLNIVNGSIEFYNFTPGNVALDYIHIENVDVSNGQIGITGVNGQTFSVYQGNFDYQHVYVGHVNVHDYTAPSATGVQIEGATEIVVEWSEIYNLSSTVRDGSGIYLQSCSNALVQHNESSYNHLVIFDGEGIDFGASTNFVCQYNYTHNNDGSGIFVEDDETYAPNGATVPSSNFVIRYNISENDVRQKSIGPLYEAGAIQILNSASNGEVYNNTVYLYTPETGLAAALVVNEWRIDAVQTSLHFRNNIVVTVGAIPNVYVDRPNRDVDVLFQGNDYYTGGSGYELVVVWGNQTYVTMDGPGGWRTATGQETLNGQPVGSTANPDLSSPGNGGTIGNPDLMATALNAYQLGETSSPMIGIGINLNQQFGIPWDPYAFATDPFLGAYLSTMPADFYGWSVGQNGTQNIGAYEGPG
jgi:hypothetical protein